MRSSFLAALLVAAPAVASAQLHAPATAPAPSAASAPLGRIVVGLSAVALWRTDQAFTAFGEVPSAAPELSLGVVIADPLAHLALMPELAYRHEEDDQVLLQTETARLHVDVATAGLALRWEPLAWLAPYVRATIGFEHHGVDIGSLGGDGFALLGSGGAGVEVALPLGPGLTDRGAGRGRAALGVVLEGGVVFGSRDVVQVAPHTPPGELPGDVIRTQPVRVGAFDQTAPYLRVGIVLHL